MERFLRDFVQISVELVLLINIVVFLCHCVSVDLIMIDHNLVLSRDIAFDVY